MTASSLSTMWAQSLATSLATSLAILGATALGCAATSSPPSAANARADAPTAPSGIARGASSQRASSTPSATPAELAADVATLNAVLEAGWKAAKVVPARRADDGEFLRRVTLDLIGRAPTLPEATAFLADRAASKRAALVDQLLASPAFGAHWGDLEGDLLFGSSRERRGSKPDPRVFLASAFNENRPYDRLAEALLTAQGGVDEDGAAAFLIARQRGGGGAEAVTGAASRIFLGMQIQCAQCHDHPYDPRWKQRDFYGLVGYFARTRVRRERGKDVGMHAGKDAPGSPSMSLADAAAGKRSRTYEVIDVPRGEAKMHAPGASKDVAVRPRFLGRALSARPGETRRQTFARAVIASDLFAKAFVGRVWRHLFGTAPLEPWDDLGAEADAKHPPLLLTLSDGFRDSGHDVKRLLRRMVLSTAYERSAAPPAPGQDDDGAAVRAFARARVRPLTPEQLFGSLLVATGADEMVRQRPPRGRAAASESAPPEQTDRALKLAERSLREYRFTFEDDEMADSDFDGTLPQALLLLNGDFLNSGVRAGKGGVLAGILASSPDVDVRLDRMFLAAYARLPRAEERAAFRAVLAAPAAETPRTEGAQKGQRRDQSEQRKYEDAFFALLLSTEATTNH